MQHLKYMREKTSLTQQELAEKLATTQQNIQRYENGISEPDFRMLFQMADFFDTSIDFLLGHTKNRSKIEKIEKFALGIHEEELLEKHRMLSQEHQELLLGIADILLSNEKK